ncbi:MAG: hypothetical protein LEGION0403_FIIPPAGN_00949 [Legionella sp.]|uniref:NAD(P)H-dependent oxidoreductase n=1 Tax=Legionella sp. TaxID=459 RepID=UPI003D110D96
MMSKKIAVIVGSLRKESYNRKMAHALMAAAPESLNLDIVVFASAIALDIHDNCTKIAH